MNRSSSEMRYRVLHRRLFDHSPERSTQAHRDSGASVLVMGDLNIADEEAFALSDHLPQLAIFALG